MSYKPLERYRVIDLSQLECQYCAKIMADLGADVIKVEKPGGDPSRSRGPFYHDRVEPEKSLFWFFLNTSKRGITLDVETKVGQGLLRRLLEKADFFVESFPPGYMESLGLDYKQISRLNPHIIYVSITPFGLDGPYAGYKTTDLVSCAMSGLLYLIGDTDRPPVRISVPQSRLIAGSHAAMGALAALRYRKKHGEGQLVDVSIQDAVARVPYAEPIYWQFEHTICRREGNKNARGSVVLTEAWPCKDGQIAFRIMSGAYSGSLKALVEWMAEEGSIGSFAEIQDWKNLDFRKYPQQKLDEWENDLRQFFLKHTKGELEDEAQKRKIYLSPVNNPQEIFESEQLAARKFWVDVKHPELRNTISYPGAAFKTSAGEWGPRRRAPLIGEHNQEIYEGELGLTREEMQLLKGRNVI